MIALFSFIFFSVNFHVNHAPLFLFSRPILFTSLLSMCFGMGCGYVIGNEWTIQKKQYKIEKSTQSDNDIYTLRAEISNWLFMCLCYVYFKNKRIVVMKYPELNAINILCIDLTLLTSSFQCY